VFIILLTIAPSLVAFSPSSLAKNATQTSSEASPDNALPAFVEADRLRKEQTRETNLQAIAKYKEAAEIWRSRNQFENAAKAFRNAGQVSEVLGDTQNAITYYNESVILSRKAGNALEEGRVRADLGYVLFIVGKTDEAYKQGRKAFEIGESIGDNALMAQARATIGEAHYSLGNLTKAVEYQNQALKQWRELGNKQEEVKSLVALGYYYANLADPKRSLEVFDSAAELSRKNRDIRGEGVALLGKSFVMIKLGEPQETLNLLNRARPLIERIGDRTSLAMLAGRTALVHFDMGDKESALSFAKQGKALFEEDNKTWGIAESLNFLGRVHHLFGEEEIALNYLNQAVELFKSLSMPRLEAQTLNDVGLVYTALGDNQKAVEVYKRSLKLLQPGQDQRHRAYALNYIGKSYENLKDDNSALDAYQQALPLSRESSDPVAEILSLHNLAHVERSRSDLQAARQRIEESIALAESLRTKVTSPELRATYFATVRRNYELYIDVLVQLHQQRASDGLDALAFAVSERARARSFLETLQESQANIREGVDATLLGKERTLLAEINLKAERQIRLLASNEKEEAEKVGREIAKLSAEQSSVRDQIKTSSPRYAALTQPQPLNLQEVQQQLLDDDTILLAYTLGDDRSYAWVVTRTGLSTFELPSRKEIEESATRLYKLLVANQAVSGESVNQTVKRQNQISVELPVETARLSKTILGPLAGKLGDKRLLIIPDGALQYIPFQALHDPDSNNSSPQFLLTKHVIVNELSASTLGVLLKEGRARKRAANSVAVLADPVFEVDDPRVKRASNQSTPESAESLRVKQALRDIGVSVDGVEVPRLFASGEEAETIIKSAPWGTGLKAVGFEANLARALGKELADYRVVHFATHGLINNEHPELSGIVLSLFDREGRSQNGFLRLHDIYNLRMPADLVVLSACSTGLGKDVRGEGLIGLTRGFMYAGASGVVASLWKVDDAATAELMKRFYEGLFSKGLSPAAALREAQLEMSKQPRWQSPYYWAGFVIQGSHDGQISGSYLSYLTQKRVAIVASLLGALLVVSLLILHRRRQKVI
jgi:CHAT domain-containing protein